MSGHTPGPWHVVDKPYRWTYVYAGIRRLLKSFFHRRSKEDFDKQTPA